MKASSARVTLDAPRDADFETLFEWANDSNEVVLWSARRSLLLYEDFVDHVRARSRLGLFVVIRDRDAAEAVGFIEGAVHERDSTAEFLVYVRPESRRKPAAFIGIARFVDQLFVNYPTRKAYCEVYGFNRQSLRWVQRFGFVEEGRFRDYIWWDDRFWDVCVFSLDRATWVAGQHGVGAWGRAARVVARLEQRLSKGPGTARRRRGGEAG